MKKIVFLDRDGVVNVERGEYTFKIEDFEFHSEIIQFLKDSKELGYQFILITNQGGVAKGLYHAEDVKRLHIYMEEELNKKGIKLLDIFCSFHHDEIGESLDRKPDSLMLERAIYRHSVDVSKSIFIGDSERDIFAASKMNIRAFKIVANGKLMHILEELK